MPVRDITDIDKLRKINDALISRVERSMDQQGNAFSLFQTAINLETRVRSRTEELSETLRRLEESNVDLVSAKEAAERANLSKTRFLAAASHDVLQPLNAAQLTLSALADLQTSPDALKLVRQVERSLETMDDLLRTLLDISKLDAGVVRPETENCPLDQIFSSLRSDFQPLAAKKGLRLRVRSTQAWALTDRVMLSRMLQNIVSNAIRYTRAGGVFVGVRNRAGMLRIEVADTGYGIPDDERTAIFEEFHRGPVAMHGEFAARGLGLGLSIVRRMADALGHAVTFTSRMGRGTVFHIDVPRGTVARLTGTAIAEPERPRGYGLFGTRVLLVENDEAVAEATRILLERWECDVRVASSQAEAKARLTADAWRPDIIIADQHLEHGDLGTDTVAMARLLLRRTTPALIVSADASPDLEAAARTSGIELMRKPVKPAELRALLAHLLA